MKSKKNPHSGSTFDSYLEKEGLAFEVGALAAKRTFVYQLQKALEKSGKNKSYLRNALGSPSTVERLMNAHLGLSLETMSKAASLVGCDLELKLVPKRMKKSA